MVDFCAGCSDCSLFLTLVFISIWICFHMCKVCSPEFPNSTSTVSHGGRVVWCHSGCWCARYCFGCLLLLLLPVISLASGCVCPQPGGLVGFRYWRANGPLYRHQCLQDIENDLCQEAEARWLSRSCRHVAPNYHLALLICTKKEMTNDTYALICNILYF